MFEYHGWITLRTDVMDDFGDEDEKALEKFIKKLNRYTATLSIKENIDVRQSNGLHALIIFGHSNHRRQSVIDLFQWIAENARCSYGLLYIHDDEDHRGVDYSNHFRVWKLVLGQLEELDDPFLSPYIPTVEFPYVSSDKLVE